MTILPKTLKQKFQFDVLNDLGEIAISKIFKITIPEGNSGEGDGLQLDDVIIITQNQSFKILLDLI